MEIWDLHREDRMADYKDKLDEWQQAARRKARELDEKYAISDLVGEVLEPVKLRNVELRRWRAAPNVCAPKRNG